MVLNVNIYKFFSVFFIMITLEDEALVKRVNNAISQRRSPLLLKTILRLNTDTGDWGYDIQHLLDYIRVEEDELKEELDFLLENKLVLKSGNCYSNTLDGNRYARCEYVLENPCRIFGRRQLDKEQFLFLLRRIEPYFLFDIKKTVEVDEEDFEKLQNRANDKFMKVWPLIYEDIRETFGFSRGVTLPVNGIKISNPMTVNEKYKNLEEAIEWSDSPLIGDFVFRPAFISKGKAYLSFPLKVFGYFDREKGKDYRVDIHPDSKNVWELPVAVQAYGAEKEKGFFEEIKDTLPEKRTYEHGY